MAGITNRKKRLLSLLLSVVMIMTMLPSTPLTAFAAADDNLCEHHTEHTADCHYEEDVHECHYECAECAEAETTEAAPVCDCGTDDASVHATSCPAYVAPENPVCTCAEKCVEANVWCDVCGFDVTACQGTDTAVVYEDETAPYLTFTASAEQTLTITVSGSYTLDESLQYSVNEGEWAQLTAGTAITFGGDHGTLRLRGKSSTGMASSETKYAQITFSNSDVPVACSGDIRTLVDYENHTTVDTSNARFCKLFYQCTSLTAAPELPATALADYCYKNMFYGCESLIAAPELPATTVAEYCYSYMFYKCTSLTTAPEVLPAETLAKWCYQSMFSGCESLIAAPKLPATTLATRCYDGMFYGCVRMTAAPELPATTLATYCYNGMFNGCYSMTGAIELPAATLTQGCYYYMLYGCDGLDSITMLATDISAKNCLTSWVQGVASTGTFTKAATMESLPTGVNGIPEGWTIACNHSTGAEGDKAATCTTKAYCSVCESEYGEPLGHSTGAEGDKTATCTTKAYCSVCESEYGELSGHSTTAEGDKVATCATLAYCSACQSEYGELADHSTTATGDKPATCTTLAYCSACQSEYGEVDADNHEKDTYTNGFRDCCGAYDSANWNERGYYEIENAGQLFWFAELVNTGEYYADAVLTADIEMNGLYWKAMGTSSATAYTGTFNGRGFSIKNLNRNNGQNEGSRASFAYYVGAGGCITNVIFDAPSVFCQGHADANASAVVALRNSGTISNCMVIGGVIQLGNYAYLAGIAGVNETGGIIENCGVVNTELTRRFGHTHSRAAITTLNNGTVRNCFAYGCVYNNDNDANGGIIVSGNAPENCYYYTASTVATTYGTAMPADQFASGEVAYLLNGDQSNIIWKQTIGEDTYPNFVGETVYVATACDDVTTVYSNIQVQTIHFWGEPVFTWSADYTELRVTLTCTVHTDQIVTGSTTDITVDTTDPTKMVYSGTVTIDGVKYTNEVKASVISVNISWGAMEFTYTDGDWLPESHSYADGAWTPEADDGNIITVTNNGSVAVNVTFTYTETVTEVEGSFTDENGGAITSPVELAVGEGKKYKLILDGEPSSSLENAALGSVTVTITLPE